MRVAISALFWNQPATGSGQYVRRLVMALTQLQPGPELLLVAPRATTLLRTPRGVECHNTLAAAFNGPGKLWYEQRAFVGASRARGADVLHVPYWAPPFRPGRPLVVTIHDLIPLLLADYRGGPLVRAYTACMAHTARGADLILTDSHASARDITANLAVPAPRVRVVPLAADDVYRPLAPDDAEATPDRDTRARLGLPESYLLYLGGFDRRKSVPELIRAYAIAGLAPEIPLVIAGRLPGNDTAFAPDPRPVSAGLGIGASVHYTGWVEEDDKPALYRGARAFVFPSRYEGFGLPVLEALACGTPVIATSGSSLDEVAGPGGLLVPPGDAAALADAMRALCTDDTLRTRLSGAGLLHASAFAWDRTARETASAYAEVTGG